MDSHRDGPAFQAAVEPSQLVGHRGPHMGQFWAAHYQRHHDLHLGIAPGGHPSSGGLGHRSLAWARYSSGRSTPSLDTPHAEHGILLGQLGMVRQKLVQRRVEQPYRHRQARPSTSKSSH